MEDRALSNAVRHLRGEREQMNMNNARIVKVNCAQVDCAARINTRRAQEEITLNESVLYSHCICTVHEQYCTVYTKYIVLNDECSRIESQNARISDAVNRKDKEHSGSGIRLLEA